MANLAGLDGLLFIIGIALTALLDKWLFSFRLRRARKESIRLGYQTK